MQSELQSTSHILAYFNRYGQLHRMKFYYKTKNTEI